MSNNVAALMENVRAKNPAEPEFHQAVHEVAESLVLVLDKHPEVAVRLIEARRKLVLCQCWGIIRRCRAQQPNLALGLGRIADAVSNGQERRSVPCQLCPYVSRKASPSAS